MKGKILFVAGLGIGYVLGTRAGREQYEKLKASALNVWNDPSVQKRVDQAEAYVKDKAPDVAEFVTDNAKKAVSQVVGRTKPAAKRASSTAKSTVAKASRSSSNTAKS